MKKLTNHSLGTRGVNLKDGTIHWIEPGATVEIDPKDIVGELPDLGKPSERPASDDDDLIAAVEAENTDLKKRVTDAEKERDDHKSASDASAKQVDDLTTANGTLTTENADLKAKLEAATKK